MSKLTFSSLSLFATSVSLLISVMAKTIAIIGAGASGITCIKEVLEAGFTPICYEKGSYTGGLWRYHDSDEDGIASVMRSTIINSSKEMSAYSDFPPPKELPNYCHNSLMVRLLLLFFFMCHLILF